MIPPETIEALAAHRFLRGMSREYLEKLASHTQWVTVTTGQYLGREHEAANAFYLIQSGQVAIEMATPHDGRVRLQTIAPGEVVGWSWLVPPHRWQFDARTLDPVQALALDAESLRWRCHHDPDLGYELLQRLVGVIASRLAATRRKLLEVEQ
jgi:CRP/FNR family transcriptional regulator, cyclic AMP receptor protein